MNDGTSVARRARRTAEERRESDDSSTLMSRNWIKNLHSPRNGSQTCTHVGRGLGWSLFLRVFAMRQKYFNLLCILRFFPHVSGNERTAKGPIDTFGSVLPGMWSALRGHYTWKLIDKIPIFLCIVYVALVAQNYKCFRIMEVRVKINWSIVRYMTRPINILILPSRTVSWPKYLPDITFLQLAHTESPAQEN